MRHNAANKNIYPRRSHFGVILHRERRWKISLRNIRLSLYLPLSSLLIHRIKRGDIFPRRITLFPRKWHGSKYSLSLRLPFRSQVSTHARFNFSRRNFTWNYVFRGYKRRNSRLQRVNVFLICIYKRYLYIYI